jgi:myosin heavy subunit
MQGLNVSLDKSSIGLLKEQYNNLIKELETKGKINFSTDSKQIKKEFSEIKGGYEDVVKQLGKMGRISSPPKMFYDQSGNLSKFIVELERAEGLIEKITLRSNNSNRTFQSTRSGEPNLTENNFDVSSVSESDNRQNIYNSQLKETKKNLQELESLENKIENEKKASLEEEQSVINQIEEHRLQMIKNREAEEEKYNQIQQKYVNQSKLDDYNDQKKKELQDYENEFNGLLEQEKLETQEYEKQFKSLVEQEKQEQSLAEQMAKGREQAELRRKEEEKLLEVKQATASNKAQEEEYNANLKLTESIEKYKNKQIEALDELKYKFKNVITDENMFDGFTDDLNKISPASENVEKDMESLNNKFKEFKRTLAESEKVQKLGDFKQTIDTDVFGQSTQEIEKYIKGLYGARTEVVSLQKATDGLGNSNVTATVRTKTANNEFKEEKLVLDQATNSIYKQNESVKQSSSHMHNFSTSIKMAFQSLVSFASMTAIVYGSINQLKEAISFVNSINKSQTNIQMIGGYSRDQVQGLTKDFSNLADELHTTTDAVMSGAEEFLRAGNTIEETRSLLQSSSIGSAISGQSNADMSEQLIAISNGFKMATSDAKQMMNVIDVLSTLDNNSASSMGEISNALTKTASSAQMAGKITCPII